MAITDINISEQLETNAPSIRYRGNEGPKSPQEIEQMMMTSVDDPFYRGGDEDEHSFRMFGKPYKELNADELDEFREEMMRLMNKFSGGQPLPQDPTKPVNPFAPKPQGPTLPNRQMAAYGGIMGLDGRRRYGIGSWFQEKKDKFFDDIIPNEIKENPLLTAAAIAGGDYFLNDGKIGKKILDFIPQGVKDLGTDAKNFIFDKRQIKNPKYDPTKPEGPGNYKTIEGSSIASKIGGSIAENIVPIVGGIGAGLFTKNTAPNTPGLPSDNTALNLADWKKAANLLDQKQAMAGGFNFAPAVSARKFTPEEMAVTYAQSAANGGRIGYNQGNAVVDYEGDPNYQGWKKIYEVNPEAASMNENHKQYENYYMSQKNMKAEGVLMDLGGMEKDYRAEGGFVPIGAKEKADDVPARLSVNEFVFTADAVRNAGGGDIDKGAEVMENLMDHLEAGGQVSKESQGLEGAQEMYNQQQMLQSRME